MDEQELKGRLVELEDRFALVDAQRDELVSIAERAVEQALRAIGRLDRAAEFCRGLEQRLLQLEANTQMAGASLVTAGEGAGSS